MKRELEKNKTICDASASGAAGRHFLFQTSLREVQEIVGRDRSLRKVPVVREILSDLMTPVEAMRILKNVSGHVFLLESAEDARVMGRYTFLGYAPRMEIACRDHVLHVSFPESSEVSPIEQEIRQDGRWQEAGADRAEKETAAAESSETEEKRVYRTTTDHPSGFIKHVIAMNKAPRLSDLPPLTGGLVGYFSYDYIRYGEPELRLTAPDAYGFDDVNLMLFDRLICFDNYRGRLILIANCDAADPAGDYSRALADLDEMEDLLRNGTPAAIPAGHLTEPLKPRLTEAEFSEKVEEIRHHIHEGDIFQLVFSNPMTAGFTGSLFDTYRILRTENPSPYMFYFTGDDVEIAGASPETLVKVSDRVVRTFPLAGTRPRGRDPEEDRRLEEELLQDPKERAEHNMLVDLGRNDLGRLCRYGTVEVERYMDVLRYSHVMHIGSEVKGVLRDDVEPIDTIDSVLPAGTLSGAPKFMACQLINDLEGDHRGIYGGAIGYVDFTGSLDVCIAIRLAYKRRGRVFVRSGAGIVADSVPANEYRECLNKAKAVTEAIALAGELR